MKKVIIISGANLFSGGTLSIIQDCLKYADKELCGEFRVIALVNNSVDFKYCNNIEFLEFSDIRKSYFHRLYYEYWYYRGLSARLKPFLWLSLNDTSSNVYAERSAVYCHNPTPFKKMLFSDLINQTSVFFFTLFYKFLYRINIKKNDFVIVQQDWIRARFSKMFNLSLDKIIVSPPVIPQEFFLENNFINDLSDSSTRFCYATFPRPFKNIEIIGEAVNILNKEGFKDFSVVVTIDGSENRYSSQIVKRYGNLSQIRFVGLISRTEVFKLYGESDCLIFPSTLETWGLPITEFKLYKKTILLANLDYAHETLGDYDKGIFFNPTDAKMLAAKMLEIINNCAKYTPHYSAKINDPIVRNWSELFDVLLKI